MEKFAHGDIAQWQPTRARAKERSWSKVQKGNQERHAMEAKEGSLKYVEQPREKEKRPAEKLLAF